MTTRGRILDHVRARVARRVQWAARRIRGTTDLEALRRAGLTVGEGVFIGLGAFIDPDFCFLISIGDHSTLSINVTILAHDASTRHLLGWSRLAPVRIGSQAFLGAGSLVLPGVTIGDRSLVAAGSIVRHDVPPGTIVGGNPARVIGDVSTYIAGHQERLASTPHWPRAGWTASTGITPERIAEMRAILQDGHEAYIT
jgi:maltose O-acetyltransferase